MKIRNNPTADIVVQFKKKTGKTWVEVAKFFELSRQTLYKRMEHGNWQDKERVYIKHRTKSIA